MRGLWDRGRIAAACLLIAALAPAAGRAAPAVGLSSGGAGSDSNRAEGPASASVRLARQYGASGDWQSALSLLAAAREIDGADSDVRYLSALSLLKTADDARGALEQLDAGLVSNTYYIYNAEDLILLKASLLVRTMQYRETLSLLAPPSALAGGAGPAPEGDIIYESADRRLLRIKALFGLGSPDERARAFDETAEAAKLYPADARFAVLFFKNARADIRESTAAADLASLFLGRLYGLADSAPELRLLALPFMPDQSTRRDSILAYRAMGGSPAASCLVALEYGVIDDAACIEELFSSGSIDRVGLDRLKNLLRSSSGRAAFEKALAAYSGRIYRDGNGDGWAEEWGIYSKGLLTEFSIDSDQDGRVELSAVCREGLPAAIQLRRPELSMNIEYSRYPYVQSLKTLDSSGHIGTDYRFGPEAFIYKPLQMEAYPDARDDIVYLGRGIPAFDPVGRAAAAAALSMACVNGQYRDVYILNSGVILRRERYLEGRLVAVLNYDNGRPGVEKFDSDGDGRYETERHYNPEGDGSETSILSLRSDTNGDGLFDYSEELTEPYLKQWDFDCDGLMDAQQRTLADGRRERRFSSRLNGVFDEVLIVDADGKIISFERDGRALNFVQDSNPVVKWIGRKGFDIGSNLPPLEGVYRYKGKRYRLVYAHGEAFAELVE